MRGMRGSRGSYTPRGGGVATSQQAASGLVISNVSDYHDYCDHDHDYCDDKMMMIIIEVELTSSQWSCHFQC